MAAADAQAAVAQVNFDYCAVRAPFDGVVTTKDAQIGEIISPLSAGGGFTRTGVGTTVATRAREIATLPAIGFRGPPVVVAVMLETMLLALLGGIGGGLLAWLVFNGYSASTLAQGAVGTLSFKLAVTAALLWTGLKWALAIGFIGGLFPAVCAARLPVTTALREP